MRAGRVTVLRDGELLEMEEDILLPDGTRVTVDGTVVMPDGTTRTMMDGEAITMDGEMVEIEELGDEDFEDEDLSE